MLWSGDLSRLAAFWALTCHPLVALQNQAPTAVNSCSCIPFASRRTTRQLSRYRTFIFSFSTRFNLGRGGLWVGVVVEIPPAPGPPPRPHTEAVAVHRVSMVEKSGSFRSAISPPIWGISFSSSTRRAQLLKLKPYGSKNSWQPIFPTLSGRRKRARGPVRDVLVATCPAACLLAPPRWARCRSAACPSRRA